MSKNVVMCAGVQVVENIIIIDFNYIHLNDLKWTEVVYHLLKLLKEKGVINSSREYVALKNALYLYKDREINNEYYSYFVEQISDLRLEIVERDKVIQNTENKKNELRAQLDSLLEENSRLNALIQTLQNQPEG